MTRFWRNGFYRTSVYGVTHWVDGHLVDRDDWSRGSGLSLANYYRGRLKEVGVDGRATAAYVSPNAVCPVCGSAVFFYQNEFGSRVFFDELGPPWPKHPCTDAQASGTVVQHDAAFIEPMVRDSEQISDIARWEREAGLDLDYGFWVRYGTSRWNIWQIQRRFSVGSKTLLLLSIVDPGKRERYMCLSERLPKSLRKGSLVFLNRGWLSHLNASRMAHEDVKVERVKSERAFVDLLTEARS